jgi:hypothetical protein
VGGQRHSPVALPSVNLVPIVQEAGWAPGTVWMGAENLAPTGIRSPDCPAHSESRVAMGWALCAIPANCVDDTSLKISNYTNTMRFLLLSSGAKLMRYKVPITRC